MMHLSSLLYFMLLHLPFCHQTCHFCEWSQAELPTIHSNLLEPAWKLEMIYSRRGVETRASRPAYGLTGDNSIAWVPTCLGECRFLPGSAENMTGLQPLRTGFRRLVKPDNGHTYSHPSTQITHSLSEFCALRTNTLAVLLDTLDRGTKPKGPNWTFHLMLSISVLRLHPSPRKWRLTVCLFLGRSRGHAQFSLFLPQIH